MEGPERGGSGEGSQGVTAAGDAPRTPDSRSPAPKRLDVSATPGTPKGLKQMAQDFYATYDLQAPATHTANTVGGVAGGGGMATAGGMAVRPDCVHKSCQATARSGWLVSERVHRLRTSQQRLACTHSFVCVCGHEDSTAADGGWPRSEAVLDRDGTKSAASFACIHGRHMCDAAVIERTGYNLAERRDRSVSIWRRGAGRSPMNMPPCTLHAAQP